MRFVDDLRYDDRVDSFVETRDAVRRIKLIRRENRNASGCHSVESVDVGGDFGGQKCYTKVGLSLSGVKVKLHLCYLNAATSSDPFGAVWAYENDTRRNLLTNQSDALLAKRSLGSSASAFASSYSLAPPAQATAVKFCPNRANEISRFLR